MIDSSSSMELGTVRGIHVRVSRSWGFIFIVTTILMAELVAQEFPALGAIKQYVWGLAAGLLFFLSILFHELGHSVVAQAHGIRVHSITLHPFGGLAKLARDAVRPMEEFWIALAGPVASLLLGVMMYLPGQSLSDRFHMFGFMLVRIGEINVLVGLFNLLPGFPLDGGRVLRALIWWFNKDYRQATFVAARIGQGIAALCFMFGLALLFAGQGVPAFWVLLFGFYLFNSARVGFEQAELREELRKITVGELALEDLPHVSKELTAEDFLSQYDLAGGRDRSFLVTDDHIIVGLVSLGDVRRAQAKKRAPSSPRLDAVMQPIERFERIAPQTDLVTVVEKMEFAEISHLPVVENNELLGFIGREKVTDIIRRLMEPDEE